MENGNLFWLRKMIRPRVLVSALGLAAIILACAYALRPPDGCPAFIPAKGILVAHAGGGLPHATYTNSREAMNLAADHGFKYIELDFRQDGNRLILQHDGHPQSDMSIADLLFWLEEHPEISVITDFKTDNVQGLKMLADFAGDEKGRFIPQIYSINQYAQVEALDFESHILTVYKIQKGTEPIEEINNLPLLAVTMPFERRASAKDIDHRVFLHTVNEPLEGFDLYTDCLIPIDSQE